MVAAEVTRRAVARGCQEIRLVTSAATVPRDFSDTLSTLKARMECQQRGDCHAVHDFFGKNHFDTATQWQPDPLAHLMGMQMLGRGGFEIVAVKKKRGIVECIQAR